MVLLQDGKIFDLRNRIGASMQEIFFTFRALDTRFAPPSPDGEGGTNRRDSWGGGQFCPAPAALAMLAVHSAERRAISSGDTSSTWVATPQE